MQAETNATPRFTKAHALDVALARKSKRSYQLKRLVIRRLMLMVPILVGISATLFALGAASPFDPLVGYLGDNYGGTNAAQRAELSGTLGLHNVWWSTWTNWLVALAHGDLGQSRIYGQPVSQVIAQRLPWTLLLSGLSMLIAMCLGLLLGTFAGLRSKSVLGRGVEWFGIVVQASPPYVISLGLIVVFALTLGWFPAGGSVGAGQPMTLVGVAKHLVLPTCALGVSQLPWLILSVRASVLETLASEPVRAAIARGLPYMTVIKNHVLPVSFAPVVSIACARLPELFVGAVLVEDIFGWPGIAGALVAAAKQLDFSLLAVLALSSTLLVLVGSLLADVTYALLDPRVNVDD